MSFLHDRRDNPPKVDLPPLNVRAQRWDWRWMLIAVCGLGLCVTIINLDLPLLRNSLLYHEIYENLRANDFALWQVCHDPSLVFNKPCGFPALVAPIAYFLGLNSAMKLLSFAGAAIFIVAAMAAFRRFSGRLTTDASLLPVEVLVLAFNPLVMYQFWSAYPDALFAAAAVYTLVLLDRMVAGDSKPFDPAVYGTLLIGSMLIKHGTAALIPLHALYVFASRPLQRRRNWLLVFVPLLIALGFLAAGQFGMNPLLNLEENRGQLTTKIDYWGNVGGVAVFLGSTLGLASVLLARAHFRRADLPLMLFAIGYVHLFTVYHGSQYNPRYYLPILPILVMFVCRSWSRLSVRWRSVIALTWVSMSAAGVIIFNERHVYALMEKHISLFRETDFGPLDCLRMGQHLRVSRAIDEINRFVPPGGELVFVSSYYGEGGRGVYQRDGLIRSDIRVLHVETLSSVWDEAQKAFVYFHPPSTPSSLRGLARVGEHLYRLQ